MGSTPYELNIENINRLVKDHIIGNYALGNLSESGTFVVHYVGRSDTDLKQRLTQHLSDAKKYSHFKFSFAISIKEAYLKECKNYHDFGGQQYLDNENHPARPHDMKDSCPYCGK